jgi:hypothetical protein
MLVDGFILYQLFVVILGGGRIHLLRWGVMAYLVRSNMGGYRSEIDVHSIRFDNIETIPFYHCLDNPTPRVAFYITSNCLNHT